MERGRLGAERRLSVRRTQVVQVLVHNQGPSVPDWQIARPTYRAAPMAGRRRGGEPPEHAIAGVSGRTPAPGRELAGSAYVRVRGYPRRQGSRLLDRGTVKQRGVNWVTPTFL